MSRLFRFVLKFHHLKITHGFCEAGFYLLQISSETAANGLRLRERFAVEKDFGEQLAALGQGWEIGVEGEFGVELGEAINISHM